RDAETRTKNLPQICRRKTQIRRDSAKNLEGKSALFCANLRLKTSGSPRLRVSAVNIAMHEPSTNTPAEAWSARRDPETHRRNGWRGGRRWLRAVVLVQQERSWANGSGSRGSREAPAGRDTTQRREFGWQRHRWPFLPG